MISNVVAFPKEMKEFNNWVCCRITSRKNPDGTLAEKRIKKPIKAFWKEKGEVKDGASPVDPADWSSLDEAVKYAQDYKNGIEYVGHVFTEEEPWTFIDLDHCVTGRNKDAILMEPWAEAIIQKFNSYTEISVSGKGIHIVVRGKKPAQRCKAVFEDEKGKKHEIEMYDKKRYCVMTGDVYRGRVEITDGQEFLNTFYKAFFPNESAEGNTHPISEQETLPDDVLIEKAETSHQGVKFNKLYSGNWEGVINAQGQPYPSISEATGALVAMLAFWTDRNSSQMDRLFRASGLMRDKWDEKRGDSTWGENEIEKAIVICPETYSEYVKKRGRKGRRKKI